MKNTRNTARCENIFLHFFMHFQSRLILLMNQIHLFYAIRKNTSIIKEHLS